MPNREQWLDSLVERLRGWPEYGLLPEVHVGVGFTSKGARSKRIGECWTGSCSADGRNQIFLHPSLSDPIEVAATLAHELIHAAIGVDAQHGPAFKAVALGIGLEGRMTATVPGAGFKARIAEVLDAIGPYPHASLTPSTGGRSGPPTQSTRMIKCECVRCGYVLRTTRKWLDIATPSCPQCDVFMVVE